MIDVLPTVIFFALFLTAWGYVVVGGANLIASKLARREPVRALVGLAIAITMSIILTILLTVAGIMKIGG
ncbi:MAG: hypothetical protein DRJ31_11165 [Candidatus Methanomethylicota archaeon]|uniref:Uncharacterized protein n=1 Tax=Thermoproteota archaeon TaxID=2056631 RepID=A0A497ELN5_9CREN|nr:MAG: hypothetical protein DRJ31_11165 [Candidatus Verstraetearchaeota archaeon]